MTADRIIIIILALSKLCVAVLDKLRGRRVATGREYQAYQPLISYLGSRRNCDYASFRRNVI